MLILANIIQEAFSPLISLFESILVFIHDHGVASWGLAIVLLTVLVRAVMVPLTFSQFRSMRKMQLVAPELKALKEKYKDDKQRQNEEMMKLYREKGSTPSPPACRSCCSCRCSSRSSTCCARISRSTSVAPR